MRRRWPANRGEEILAERDFQTADARDNALRAILDEVDRGFDEQIAFTLELVRRGSPRGREAAALDWMEAAYKSRGLSVDRFSIEPEKIKHLPGFAPISVDYSTAENVVGVAKGDGGGRSLILNGHIDVVPPGPEERWSRPPFEAYVKDGWLYGRGGGDMKAGHVAALFAYDAVRRAGFATCGDVIFQSVTEEEATGNGTLACLERGYKANCVLIPEPLDPKLLRAQVGLVWFKVKVNGVPQHASGYKEGGSNAIENAIDLWNELKSLEGYWNARKNEFPPFDSLKKPISMNLGVIRGGDWPSNVPAECEMEIRLGVFPNCSLDEVVASIENAVASAVDKHPNLAVMPPQVSFHGHMAEGYVLEGASTQEAALADCHQMVFDEPLEEYVTPAGSDARFFGLYQDTPALVYGPTCERPHGIDERVDIQSVRQVTKTIALFIVKWCGVEPSA